MRKLRGRPNQGKTQTFRERTVDVYLPTLELVEEWKKPKLMRLPEKPGGTRLRNISRNAMRKHGASW